MKKLMQETIDDDVAKEEYLGSLVGSHCYL